MGDVLEKKGDKVRMTFDEYPLHDSIRGWFGRALYFEMQRNEDIFLITADLGYKLWDLHQRDFPDRFYNVGASEQCAVGTGVGLALSGKIPFVFSITTFLLFRPAEWIRNYLNHEQIPVKLIGSGMDNDYAHDGISHQPSYEELVAYFKLFPNIDTTTTSDKTQVPELLHKMITNNKPAFMCLRR
jgi:transketolase